MAQRGLADCVLQPPQDCTSLTWQPGPMRCEAGASVRQICTKLGSVAESRTRCDTRQTCVAQGTAAACVLAPPKSCPHGDIVSCANNVAYTARCSEVGYLISEDSRPCEAGTCTIDASGRSASCHPLGH
jgi:hypothetical protein